MNGVGSCCNISQIIGQISLHHVLRAFSYCRISSSEYSSLSARQYKGFSAGNIGSNISITDILARLKTDHNTIKLFTVYSLFNMVRPRQKLPAWYYRLLALTIKEDRDVSPEDFDEDLSSLSGLSSNSEADVSTCRPLILNVSERNSDCKFSNPG